MESKKYSVVINFYDGNTLLVYLGNSLVKSLYYFLVNRFSLPEEASYLTLEVTARD